MQCKYLLLRSLFPSIVFSQHSKESAPRQLVALALFSKVTNVNHIGKQESSTQVITQALEWSRVATCIKSSIS